MSYCGVFLKAQCRELAGQYKMTQEYFKFILDICFLLGLLSNRVYRGFVLVRNRLIILAGLVIFLECFLFVLLAA